MRLPCSFPSSLIFILPYAVADCTMAVDAQTSQDYFTNLTRFWQIHHVGGVCQTPSSISLWFICLWTFNSLWAIILGGSNLRKKIRKSMELEGKPEDGTEPVGTVISLILHVMMSVATAAILRKPETVDGSAIALAFPLLAWFARPLPATASTVTALLHRRRYQESAMELHCVEILYSFFSLPLYGLVWTHAFRIPGDAEAVVQASHSVDTSMKMLQAGVVLGTLTTIYGLITIFICYEWPDRTKVLNRIACNTIRTICGFLIWGGVLGLSTTAFCPTPEAMKSVTVLWAFVPALDHAVRTVFTAGRPSKPGPSNSSRAETSAV